jgi:hypothetical protein
MNAGDEGPRRVGPSFAISSISAPPMKARSPAPVSTTARSLSFVASPLNASTKRLIKPELSVFNFA